MVTIQALDQDKYGRTIGDVILEDGRNLSRELVKAGYALAGNCPRWAVSNAFQVNIIEEFLRVGGLSGTPGSATREGLLTTEAV